MYILDKANEHEKVKEEEEEEEVGESWKEIIKAWERNSNDNKKSFGRLKAHKSNKTLIVWELWEHERMWVPTGGKNIYNTTTTIPLS